MYPHERSLVKRLAGMPFSLVGVNSDTDKDKLKDIVAKENITWRSFIDGSTQGPISRAWNIRGWPSIFVIDAKGVIRYRDLRGAALDDAIDTLLKEMGETPPPREEHTEE